MNEGLYADTDLNDYLVLAASFLVSAFVTFLSIRYAQKRRLIDQPGRRRSHSKATARGGGIGLVVAVLIFFCGPLLFSYPKQAFASASALLAVALVGWIDDHRPLSAWIRILVHFSAAFWLLLPLGFKLSSWQIGFVHPLNTTPFTPTVFFLAYGFGVLLMVWSINLHNFMDGINGLLACQAVFVFFALGAICGYSAYVKSQEMWWLWMLGAATLGFLPFNFPRAQIFMGDVGSGALGLLIALAVIVQMGAEAGGARASGIIACSAFVVDATCTLLSRLLRGKRWYSAHREHLYQWMARCGMSHSQVVAWYMAWNFAIVIPILYWVNRAPLDSVKQMPQSGYGWAVVVYTAALLVWLFGKNWCYSTVKSRYSHANT